MFFSHIRVLFTPFLLSFILFNFLACSSVQKEETDREPLTIGFATWPGFDLIYYAQEKGIFEKNKLKIKLIHYPDQATATKALENLEIDAVMTSIWDALNMQGGHDFDIILSTNVSKGADGIVAIKEITSIQELKGKKVSAQSSSVNELILLEALNLYKMQIDDVQTLNMTNEDALAQLFHKQIQAAVLWEPLLSLAKKEIGGNILFTTKELNSLVIDIVLVQSNSINTRAKDWHKFMLSWFELMQSLKKEPTEVFSVVANKLQERSFAKSYAGLQAGTLRLNQKMFLDKRLNHALEQIKPYLPPSGNPAHLHINHDFVEASIQQFEAGH